MSSVTARTTSGVGVVLVRDSDATPGDYVNALGAWVSPTSSSSTGWVVDTSGATEGTYSAADRRSFATSINTAGTDTTNLTFAYSAAADNGASGAVQWGLPRLGSGTLANTSIVVVFAPSSR